MIGPRFRLSSKLERPKRDSELREKVDAITGGNGIPLPQMLDEAMLQLFKVF
jgi:hypothetical protein